MQVCSSFSLCTLHGPLNYTEFGASNAMSRDQHAKDASRQAANVMDTIIILWTDLSPKARVMLRSVDCSTSSVLSLQINFLGILCLASGLVLCSKLAM
jgi:hypothetical protein